MSGISRTGGKVISVTIASSAAAYTAGMQVGVPVKIQNAVLDSSGAATLTSLTILDSSKQNLAMDIFLFSSQPTSAGADHATDTLSVAQLTSLCLGQIKVVAGDYSALANAGVATKPLLGLKLQAATGLQRPKDLWLVVITRGTPTYTANCLQVQVGLDQN